MLSNLSNIYFEQGLENMQHSKLTTAMGNFQSAFYLSRDNWKALNLLGLCLYTTGNFEKAKLNFSKSIYINSDEQNRAYQYIDSLKESEFISICECYNNALLCAKDAKFKSAEKLLKHENLINCNIIAFINLKGLCMFKLGKKVEAVSLWKQSLLINVENKDALNYIINCNDDKKEKISFKYLLKKIFKIS